MSTNPPLERPLTAMHFGDDIEVHCPGFDEPATGTYVGYAGGAMAMVKLDGTGELVNVPRIWIHRPD